MKSLKISSSVRELIESDLRKTPNNLYVIARRFGVTKGTVSAIRDGMFGPSDGEVAKPITIKVDLEEIPARLRDHVVQIKAVNAPWLVNDDLKRARAEYDEGLVELATGRLRRQHGDALVLYKFQRKRPDARRRPYFSSIYEG